MAVNELSNTIDLESTLIRAEALFRRFQRLVDAIDKKQNFPAPRVQRASSSAAADTPPPSSPSSPPNARPATAAGKAKAEEPKKAISPELRKLLSRNVDVLPRKVVHKNGDGFTAEAGRK